jgi:hypothetical protein
MLYYYIWRSEKGGPVARLCQSLGGAWLAAVGEAGLQRGADAFHQLEIEVGASIEGGGLRVERAGFRGRAFQYDIDELRLELRFGKDAGCAEFDDLGVDLSQAFGAG